MAGWILLNGGSGGTADHGALTGLGDDDHPQYLAKAANLSDVSARQTALDNLTAVASATNEHVLTKDTATGHAIFKAVVGGGGGSITVQEIDGTPLISNVTTIKFTNGTVTDEGGGVARIDVPGDFDGGSFLDPPGTAAYDYDGGSF